MQDFFFGFAFGLGFLAAGALVAVFTAAGAVGASVIYGIALGLRDRRQQGAAKNVDQS